MTDQLTLIETDPFPAFDAAVGAVEAWYVRQGCRKLIGVDEAGRGPLAGPVVAAAVVLDLEDLETIESIHIRDSKALSPQERESAAQQIRTNASAFAICSRDHRVIDEMNILQATLQAMEQAVEEVGSQVGAGADMERSDVLIDGNQSLSRLSPQFRQRALVKGDRRSLCVAAASILAKVTRDEMMRVYHAQWPQYGFAAHKGYPTQAHREAIALYGPCPIHRRSFSGVRQYLP